MRTPVADAERVAISCRTGDTTDSDAPVRTSHVLNDNRLTERRAHMLCDDASDNIRRTARGVGHNHCDGPRWIALPPREARNGYQRSGARGQMQKLSAG